MKATIVEKTDVVEEIHRIREKISRMDLQELLELDKSAQRLEKKLRKATLS